MVTSLVFFDGSEFVKISEQIERQSNADQVGNNPHLCFMFWIVLNSYIKSLSNFIDTEN